MTGRLEIDISARIRDTGRKVLVPYITGGYPGWEDAIRAAAANGADAIEIGIPFSDPVMDGPIIQQASQAALDAGTTPLSVLEAVPGLDVDIPLVVMTYYNLVHHDGHRRFAHRLVEAGIAGLHPARPAAGGVRAVDARRRSRGRRDGDARRARPHPTSGCRGSPPGPAASSTRSVCSASRGSASRSPRRRPRSPRRLKAITDVPVLVGVGVSNAQQAYEASRVADGVIQGASVVRRLMESGPDAVGDYVAEVRAAIDA